MVQEIVAFENLHERAHELATKIAKAAPLGVQAALASSKKARMQGHNAALQTVFDDMPEIMKSEDVKEGISSFMQRREAVFTGK